MDPESALRSLPMMDKAFRRRIGNSNDFVWEHQVAGVIAKKNLGGSIYRPALCTKYHSLQTGE